MENELEDNLKGKFGEPAFTVPENYFDQLNRDIQTRIALEKIKALTNDPGFTVPEHYFEQLTPAILAKIDDAPVKSAGKTIRLWQTDLFKYATAACFILVAAVGLYFNNQQATVQQPYASTSQEQMLFDIDEDMIISELQQEQVSQKRSSVSDQELEDYILNNYSQSDIVTNL